MIKIKLNVPDEEFGTIEQIFEFKDYLSVNELFLIGLPTELMAAGLEDMQGVLGKKELLKRIDATKLLKYQIKLLNMLSLRQDFDIGSLPMPVITELVKNPKLTEAIKYSFGQGVDLKTDDVPDPKKN